jgi:hypothetical protein
MSEHLDLLQRRVGSANCRLFSLTEAVDFAEKWLNNYDSIKGTQKLHVIFRLSYISQKNCTSNC